MYTKYNKYIVYFFSIFFFWGGGENNPVMSPVSDQCYFYSKCNKNASKSINYYSIFFNFKFVYIKEWYFLKTKSDQNIYQNAPDWVNHFKIFSGSMPPNHVSCV